VTGGPASRGTEPRVHNVLRGEAADAVKTTPFGQVGTIYSGSGIELVWVSKQVEAIDEGWFSSGEVDLMLVVQGRLKVEFEHAYLPDRILDTGDVLVLPAGVRCRGYRWPREASTATVFVAAYPVRDRTADQAPDQAHGA
jgi:uncharacterized protein YjlB